MILLHRRLKCQIIPSKTITSSSCRGCRRSFTTHNSTPPHESGSQHPTPSGLKALSRRSKTQARSILGQSVDLPIRARFAPSPTGYLHLGSLRTALFNKLAASASKGSFILRIEDTDQNRLVDDAEDSLLKTLSWAGLSWDEGPDVGGPYGPYRQSERLPIYKEHAQALLEKGHAYRCFCSPEQLESQKRALHEAGKPTFYPGTCRSLGAQESDARAAGGEAHVLRLKSDTFGRPKLWDAIYGAFHKKDLEEDFVLIKTDGFPTYHFANVVDDHLMKITHVIRGEEWLISTPKHLALYQAFGWSPPTFAHLGLLVNPDGSKLSKRHASASVDSYKADEGLFPMALLSWLANLGSSFKPDVPPPRTIEDLADALTFKFTRGGIKLNPQKLSHFNAKYRDALDPQDPQMERHVILPMLRAVKTASSECGSDLVPSLLDEGTQRGYILKTLSLKQGPTTLITHHPYLFYRPQESLYRSSLQALKASRLLEGSQFTVSGFEEVLDALEDAVKEEDLWQGDASPVVARIRSALPDAAGMYDALRLVGVGRADGSSASSGSMFAILGREEWRYRLDVVRRILDEQRSQCI